MPKTRLTKTARKKIIEEVVAAIQCEKEQKAYDKTFPIAVSVIIRAAQKKYPAEDMAVLSKYKFTRHDSCGAVVAPSGQMINFELPFIWSENYDKIPIEGSELPLVPNKSCKIRSMPVSAADAKRVDNWNFAKGVLEEAIRKKARDYRAVISAARTVEDLEEILPLPSSFFEGYKKQNTSIAVSGDVLERVKSDKLVLEESS